MTRLIRRGDGYITVRTTTTGETRFQARWHDGVRWKARTFPTQDDAEDHLREIGRAKRKGQYVPDDEMTLLDAVDDYLARGQSRWRSSTYATYATIRATVIAGTIGKQQLTALTPRTMQLWIDRLGRQFSPSRVELIRAVTTGALKEAMRLGLIPSNPIQGVRMPRKRQNIYATWSRDDIRAVLHRAQDDPLMRTYYTLALTTGMRPGELRALRWSDIDLDTAVITCQRTMTRTAGNSPVVGDATKTGRARTIAVPAAVVSELRAHRSRQAERRIAHDAWYDDDLVFDRGNGSPLPQQTVARRHRRICELEGVPVIRVHDVRHVAATRMLESGINIKTVSEILGHANIQITMDIYVSVSDQTKADAAEVIGDAVFGA